MASQVMILAGTAYNQVFQIHSEDKFKERVTYGAPARQPVQHISYHPLGHIVYSTSKTITSVINNSSLDILQVYGPQKIISVQLNLITGKCDYILNNGALHSAYQIDHNENNVFEQIYRGEAHNLYTGADHSRDEQHCLYFGKGIVPSVINKRTSVVSWRGKNVKHDELDLQVPINDVAGRFFREDKFLAILHANNKLRVYDIRGTHRRPVQDISLKASPRSALTCMSISLDETLFYISNQSGEVFQLDSRKDWGVTGKYKGINTTVTDLNINHQWLVTTSLDCYVRIYDIKQRNLLKKIYFNKPLHSLCMNTEYQEDEKGEQPIAQQEEIDLSEQEIQGKKTDKIKQIRKRNKVGLKYLQPQQFDSPEQELIKQQVPSRKAWLSELNPVDRRDFQQQE